MPRTPTTLAANLSRREAAPAATQDSEASPPLAAGAIAEGFWPNPETESPKRPSNSRVRRSAMWIFLGNGAFAASQWGVIVFLTKLYDPQLIGRFGLAMAVVVPIVMFTSMQLATVLATDHRREFRLGEFLTLRVAMLLPPLVVLLGAGLLGYAPWSTLLLVLAVGAARALESVSDLCFAVFQKAGHARRIALSLLMRAGLGLAALCGVMLVAADLVLAVAASAAVSGAILLLHDAPLARMLWREKVNPRSDLDPSSDGDLAASKWHWPRPNVVRRLLAIGIPMGLALLLSSLNMNVPRYFLAYWVGTRELGIFVALAFAMRAGFYLEAALSQAALPRLARLHAESRHSEFCRLVLEMLAAALVIGLSGVLVSVFMGRTLIGWFYTAEYAAESTTLSLLMCAAAIGYLTGILKAAADATQNYVRQLPLFVLSVAISIAAGWLFIPSYGLPGAAVALMLARAGLLLGYGGLLLYVSLRHRRAALATAPATAC